MKRKYCFLLLFNFFLLHIFGSEFELYINKQTSNFDPFNRYSYTELKIGDIIDYTSYSDLAAVKDFDEYTVFFIGAFLDSKILVKAEDLNIQGSDIFSDDILSKYWISDYYFEALASGNIQQEVLKYDNYWRFWKGIDEYNQYWNWTDAFIPNTYILSNISLFKNSVCNFDDAYIIFSSLKKNKNTFTAKIKKAYDYEEEMQIKEFHNIVDTSEIVFNFDGDYLSIYLDDKLIVKLAACDKKTYSYIKKSIQTNICDSLNITWPRHADGTCDYEDVSSVKTVSSPTTNVAPNKTMTVSENLKLRSAEATTSEVITVMQAGTKVKILELGKAENIDDINSNWVKVEVLSGAKDRDGKLIKTGTIGWCYGGYLAETTEANNYESTDTKEISDIKIEEEPKQEINIGIICAIIGAVLLLLLVILIFAVRKKKDNP